MTSKVKAIPDGYAATTPYLIVDGAAKAIDFYTRAFGARETMRMPGPDGRIGHADLSIGGGHVMLADASPEMGYKSPGTLGGSPVSLVLYVENADAVVDRAVAAGATVTRAIRDEFYGDRTATLSDPFGHVWHVMTRIEDVTPEEMAKRAGELAEAATAK
jgi:PhnB protein